MSSVTILPIYGFKYSLYFFPTFFPCGLSVPTCLHLLFYSQAQWFIMSTTLWLLAPSPWPCGVLGNEQPVPDPVPQKWLLIFKNCVSQLSHWYLEIGHCRRIHIWKLAKATNQGFPFCSSSHSSKMWFIRAPLSCPHCPSFASALSKNNCPLFSCIHVGCWVFLEKLTSIADFYHYEFIISNNSFMFSS